MGNQLQKEYNIKSKPLKLPGSYTFLRFTYHPTLPQSIITIKSPHRATTMQSSTMILPILEIKNFTSSNDSFALCPRCVPLALLKPKCETEMKILMFKILKTGSEVGRCFLAHGRVLVWCEERRGLGSMAPEEVEHGKYTEKAKVFASGIALLNFLAAVHEERVTPGKKDDKKKKSDSKPSQKAPLNSSKLIQSYNPSQLSNHNTSHTLQQYTAQTLPQQIKLFFDPKDQKQYFQLLQTLESKLQVTKFWPSISQGLRQLIMNMLSLDPMKRVDLQTILGIPYFDNPEVRLYFTLADSIESLERKEGMAFMKALQLIIKQGTIFEPQILDEYIVPILISMSTATDPLHPTNYSAQAVSILIEVTKPPLQTILTSFRRAPATDKNMIRLAMEKKEKLFYLFDQQRFDSIISRMIFCSYECEELIGVAVMSTPFVMSCMKEEKFKKEVEFKLVGRVLGVGGEGEGAGKDRAGEGLLVTGLKCAIELIKNDWITSIKSFTDISFNPLTLTLQTNIHILYLYGLLIQKLPTKLLWSTMIPKLQAYMSQPQISDQLFTGAHKLSKVILERLHSQRKLHLEGDDINLEYSEEYFRLRDQLAGENRPLEGEVKKVKGLIEKYQFQEIGWIAEKIFV